MFGRDADVDHLDGRFRRNHLVPPLDVRVFDHLVALRELLGAGEVGGFRAGRFGLQRHLPDRRCRWRRHREANGGGLAFRSQRDRRRCRRTRHPAGTFRPTLAVAAPLVLFSIVTRTSFLPIHARRHLQRHDHHRRLDVIDRPGTTFSSIRFSPVAEIARVAILHRQLVGHGHAAHVELELRAERRRPERQPVRRIGLELGAARVREPYPVRVRQLRVRGDLHVRRTREGRRVLDRAEVRARRVPVEAGELDALDRRALGAAVGHVRGHADRLVPHHDAVVGDGVDAQPLCQQDRLLVLVLFLLQAEVDLESADVAQAHGPDPGAQRADAAQAGEQ